MLRSVCLITLLFTSAALSQTRFNNSVFSNGPDGSLGKAFADAKAAKDKRDAMKEAGELIAQGDYTGARNVLLRRGYLTEAAHIGALRKKDTEDQKANATATATASASGTATATATATATKHASATKPPASESQKTPDTLEVTQPRTDDALFVLKLPGLDY